MPGLDIALLIALLLAFVGFSLWRWQRRVKMWQEAQGRAQVVLAVWARQGPFRSGEDSAAAMRRAYLAVFGSEQAEQMGMSKALSGHVETYDADPETCERNRQQAAELSDHEIERLVDVAKRLDDTRMAHDQSREETHGV